jgi:hypothetical protein
MAALFGCWNDATSTPCNAPVIFAWLMAELMAVRVAPAGPASCCSTCGEWVAPTLERSGPEVAEACPVVVEAAANGLASPAIPKLAMRAQAPTDNLDTRARTGSLLTRSSRSTTVR